MAADRTTRTNQPAASSPEKKQSVGPASGTGGPADLKSYFKQLERRILVGLLIAFVLPIALLSVYFHFQFTVSLKETGKLNLTAVAESQRNTVDLFLQERLVNIFALFHSSAFSLVPSATQMQQMLQQLKEASDAFVDVGFVNDQGFQIGYAGPYPYLQYRNYSGQEWLIRLQAAQQNHVISDIYLGFRNKPHFTIAAKQNIDGRKCVLRATLDPDKFYLFLKTLSHARGVESILINQEGQLQLTDPWSSQLSAQSDFIPPGDGSSGAQVISREGETLIVAYAWLAEVRWALLVKEPQSISYAQFYRARRIMLVSTSILLVLIIVGLWLTTHTLINKSRETAEKKEELALQLLHAGKLAALGELATGVAHEINNPLAIITATSDVIKDMLNPEFNLQWTVDELQTELKVIDGAVYRARDITQQLLNFGHKNTPRLVATDIAQIVEEVVSGLAERTLALADIEVVRQFDPQLPAIEVDPDQMRQVILNLINNAGDAINGHPGTITITTRKDSRRALISVADSGKGIDSEEIKKIFNPFFTTKEVGKGTGLGLSVSLGIVESLGGSIEVQSIPGSGSVFTIVLPIRQNQTSNRQYPHTAKEGQ